MKKKRRKIILVVLLVLLVGIVAFMNLKPDLKMLVEDNLSELRSELFVGESECYRCYIASGYREEPYNCDGVKNELVPFAVISLRGKSGNIPSASYTLTVDDKEYVGQFEYDPYGSGLVVDAEVFVTSENAVKLCVTVNGKTEEVKLVSKSKDFKVKGDDVVNIICENKKEKLDELTSLRKLQAEIFIKIATDNDFTFDKSYYYVCICDRNGNTYDFLVDVDSGNIVATKS